MFFKVFIENEFRSVLSFLLELFFELEFLDIVIRIIIKFMKGMIVCLKNFLIDEKN